MMRWYVRVPEKDRLEIGQYALHQFARINFGPENIQEIKSFKNLVIDNRKIERGGPQESKRPEPGVSLHGALHAAINSGMGVRQPSGDGRQMNSAPFEEPMPIFSIGAPSMTPDVSSPTVDTMAEMQQEQVLAQPNVRQEQERAEKELRLQVRIGQNLKINVDKCWFGVLCRPCTPYL